MELESTFVLVELKKTTAAVFYFFAHRLCSLLCQRILRQLPFEELRLENDNLESDIFKPRHGEPHSVDTAEK